MLVAAGNELRKKVSTEYWRMKKKLNTEVDKCMIRFDMNEAVNLLNVAHGCI